MLTQPVSAQSLCVDQQQKDYKDALNFFNSDKPTDETDSLALNLFLKTISEIEAGRCNDSMVLINSYLKSGILHDIQRNFQQAKFFYLKIARLKSAGAAVSDSLAFQTYVFLGSDYYQLNKFDSARLYLAKAESLVQPGVALNDQARLYNTIGVLYYDNGNYKQSRNYFTRALTFLDQKNDSHKAFVVNIKTNLATADYKLGDYQGALALHLELLPFNIGSDFIRLNIGRTNAALGRNAEALEWFQKIDTKKIPGALNEMALAELRLGAVDKAGNYFDQYDALLQKTGMHANIMDNGVSQLYRTEKYEAEKNYPAALRSIQSALIAFSNGFTDTSIFANPKQFSGSFAYFRLFEALDKKAGLLSKMYFLNGDNRLLKASYDCYQLTLDFLDYIEKNYETDDAKILLKKESREAYENALSVCITLFRKEKKIEHLYNAFAISERNKGSIIASNLNDLILAKNDASINTLASEVRNVRFAIARLNIQIDREADKQLLRDLIASRTSYEMQLAELKRRMESSNAYYTAKYRNNIPRVQDLQTRLNPEQALISYYVARDELYAFVITNSSFEFIDEGNFSSLQQPLRSWISQLKNTEGGFRFGAGTEGQKISEAITMPILKKIPAINEWIIVPDGELCQLPFESLPIGNNKTGMLEAVAISYEFSAAFLVQRSGVLSKTDYEVLSFSPFSQQGSGQWPMLPGSAQETANLPGKHFDGPDATRSNFLENLNHYPVLHLATHAVASNNNPLSSFIAFYSSGKDSAENNFYLEELYGLKMDQTKLVVVSACETGEGELISNEGVMSLARGFAYAGCDATVNSLWKANDDATAYILEKFHQNLQQGMSKSKALQQARLDYIKSHDLRTTPPYWANLIILGDNSSLVPESKPVMWSSMAAGVLLLAAFALIAGRKKSRRSANIEF